MTAGTGQLGTSKAVVIVDRIADAESYARALEGSGVLGIELTGLAMAKPSTYVTADAVIVLCADITPEVSGIVSDIRSHDPEALVVIIVAVRKLEMMHLTDAHAAGASAVIVLGPPSTRFSRMVATVIDKTKAMRSRGQ